MVDDAGIFLTCAAEESRHVHKGQNRNVERIAETYEAGCFARSVAVEHAGNPTRLVGDDAGRLTVEAGKSADDVFRKIFLHFHKVAVIDNGVDNLFHVVRHVRIGRHEFVQAVIYTVDGVGACHERHLFHVVLRNERNQTAHLCNGVFFGGCHKVCYARFGGVYAGAAQVFDRHIFAGYRFYNFRTGDEHVRVLLRHHDEVGEGR